MFIKIKVINCLDFYCLFLFLLLNNLKEHNVFKINKSIITQENRLATLQSIIDLFILKTLFFFKLFNPFVTGVALKQHI